MAEHLPACTRSDYEPADDRLMGGIDVLFGARRREPQQSLATLRRRIEHFVETNLDRPDLNVRTLAEVMGCSARYIHRAFESWHCTVGEYIWQVRLERARERLLSHDCADRSISDVAFAVGFSSSSHFSRSFRARYAMTPSELRRQMLAA